MAVVEGLGDDVHFCRRWRRGRQRGQRRGIQPGDLRHIVEVDKLQQIPILDAILNPHILMLMVEIFPPLGEAHGWKSLLVEGAMIAAPQIAVAAKDQHWVKRRRELVAPAHIGDGPRQFPRGRIAFEAKRCYSFDLIRGRCRRNAFGKDPDLGLVLNVSPGVVLPPTISLFSTPFELPAFALRQLRQMTAAVETLLLAGNRDKHQSRRQLQPG